MCIRDSINATTDGLNPQQAQSVSPSAGTRGPEVIPDPFRDVPLADDPAPPAGPAPPAAPPPSPRFVANVAGTCYPASRRGTRKKRSVRASAIPKAGRRAFGPLRKRRFAKAYETSMRVPPAPVPGGRCRRIHLLWGRGFTCCQSWTRGHSWDGAARPAASAPRSARNKLRCCAAAIDGAAVLLWLCARGDPFGQRCLPSGTYRRAGCAGHYCLARPVRPPRRSLPSADQRPVSCPMDVQPLP